MSARSSITATRRASCNTGSRMPKIAPVTVYQVNGGSYHVETVAQRHARELLERLGIPKPVKPEPPVKPKTQRKRAAKLAMTTTGRRERTSEQRQRDKMYRRMRRELEKVPGPFELSKNIDTMYRLSVGSFVCIRATAFEALEYACKCWRNAS